MEEVMGLAPQVLLIDDDRALVDVLSMALEDAGFVVRTAADGKIGWEAFQEKQPDVVVLDLLMPELDGLQVCKLIRGRFKTPILMLSSRDEQPCFGRPQLRSCGSWAKRSCAFLPLLSLQQQYSNCSPTIGYC